MISEADASRVSRRAPTFATAPHAFAVGHAVRLRGGLWPTGNVYLVTALLPPSGDSLQYRIRSATETFERVATEANLERANPPTGDEVATPPENLSALVKRGVAAMAVGASAGEAGRPAKRKRDVANAAFSVKSET